MSWQLLAGLGVVIYSINGLLHRSIMKDDDSDAHAQAERRENQECRIYLSQLKGLQGITTT